MQDFSKMNKNRGKSQGRLKSGAGTSGQTYHGTRDVARRTPRPMVTTIENVQECAQDDDEEDRAKFPELGAHECASIKDVGT